MDLLNTVLSEECFVMVECDHEAALVLNWCLDNGIHISLGGNVNTITLSEYDIDGFLFLDGCRPANKVGLWLLYGEGEELSKRDITELFFKEVCK